LHDSPSIDGKSGERKFILNRKPGRKQKFNPQITQIIADEKNRNRIVYPQKKRLEKGFIRALRLCKSLIVSG